MAHLKSNKSDLLARVRRLTGQLTAIEKAISGDADCATVLHQVAGVRGAVSGLLDELIAEHLREHVAHPDLSYHQRSEGAEALINAMRRYVK